MSDVQYHNVSEKSSTPVQVHVTMADGKLLGQSNLLVIEDVPQAILLHVGDVVATGSVAADVAHNGDQLILPGPIEQLLHTYCRCKDEGAEKC